MNWCPVLADVIAGPMILLGLSPILIPVLLILAVILLTRLIRRKRRKK